MTASPKAGRFHYSDLEEVMAYEFKSVSKKRYTRNLIQIVDIYTLRCYNDLQPNVVFDERVGCAHSFAMSQGKTPCVIMKGGVSG